MSGPEILGAVAASVQLAGNCYTIGKRLIQQRSESVIADEIHEQCRALLSEINDHMTKLSPAGREAAQEVAACLQRIKHKIYLRKQRSGWVKMVQVVTGKTLVYREQIMMALYRYHVSAVLDGNEMMGQLLAEQANMSDQLREIAMPLMESLANLTSNIDSLTAMGSIYGWEEQPISNFCQEDIIKTLADAIKEEVGVLRKELTKRPILTDSSHIDRFALTLDYGTMTGYLKSIWERGDFTTDQDVWECFYDFMTISLNDDLPVPLRDMALANGGSREDNLWQLLDSYVREPHMKGTRRFRWTFKVPPQSQVPKRAKGKR